MSSASPFKMSAANTVRVQNRLVLAEQSVLSPHCLYAEISHWRKNLHAADKFSRHYDKIMLKGTATIMISILSERALWTMDYDISIIKIGWKMDKLWAIKEFNMAKILPPFLVFN